MILSRGSVMRYGSCNLYAPAFLAGRVVARPQGRLLVTPSRLAEASLPLHLGAGGRAVPLPPVAATADDHQPVAPRAVQHPVALLDDRAPATEDWTPGPPPTIVRSTVVLPLWRWPRSPGPLVTPLQAWASSSRWRPCSTEPMGDGSRHPRSRGHRRRSSDLLTAGPWSGNQSQSKNHIHGMRLEGTKSRTCASEKTTSIPCRRRAERTRSRVLCVKRREPHPAPMRDENQTPDHSPNRQETADSDRR